MTDISIFNDENELIAHMLHMVEKKHVFLVAQTIFTFLCCEIPLS